MHKTVRTHSTSLRASYDAPYQKSIHEYAASSSGQPCFCQIEVALNSAQRVIINHSFVSQADNGFAFNAQCLVLQTLILWGGDFAPAIVGIFSAKLQLLYALVVFGVQPICRVRRKLPICACFLNPFERRLVCFYSRQALLFIGLRVAWYAELPNQHGQRQTL